MRRADENPKLKLRSPKWADVRRVLVVRLRSIGDTVLATPALTALRRFLPDAQIDVLLEDWVAPVLDGFDAVDNVLTVRRGDKKDRLRVMAKLRALGYDVAYNLHGGTTAGFFTFASGAKHRVGFANYRNRFLYNTLAPSPSEFWQREKTHSAEQQLALVGWTGVPVADRPKSRLVVTERAKLLIEQKLNSKFQIPNSKFALFHPVSAFETKQWATEHFARAAEILAAIGFETIAVTAPAEREVLENLKNLSRAPIQTFSDLSLPEITALAARAALFVGNDSGIAHIAAAVNTPSVVIFGSSNTAHWRPWTDAPHEIVTENLACAPCAGYKCSEFDMPQCILGISVEKVMAAIERVLLKQAALS
jgi:lipopolysaccharide heptosyltransferase II